MRYGNDGRDLVATLWFAAVAACIIAVAICGGIGFSIGWFAA
jgi:hypothetical protein